MSRSTKFKRIGRKWSWLISSYCPSIRLAEVTKKTISFSRVILNAGRVSNRESSNTSLSQLAPGGIWRRAVHCTTMLFKVNDVSGESGVCYSADVMLSLCLIKHFAMKKQTAPHSGRFNSIGAHDIHSLPRRRGEEKYVCFAGNGTPVPRPVNCTDWAIKLYICHTRSRDSASV